MRRAAGVKAMFQFKGQAGGVLIAVGGAPAANSAMRRTRRSEPLHIVLTRAEAESLLRELRNAPAQRLWAGDEPICVGPWQLAAAREEVNARDLKRQRLVWSGPAPADLGVASVRWHLDARDVALVCDGLGAALQATSG